VLCVALALLATPAAGEMARLTIVVEGLRSTTGLLRYWLFDSAARFIKRGGAVRKGALHIEGDTVRVTIEDLPFGEYAIAVGHDEDEDGDIAKVIGAESRGVSNYDQPLRWYPTFDKAKFPVHVADVEIVIPIF
jgi:uncharacterized protein (DUF2141 family)